MLENYSIEAAVKTITLCAMTVTTASAMRVCLEKWWI